MSNDTLTPSSHLDALLAFTLMPDGRATVDPEMAGNPNQIFIQLPADPMDEKWEANGEKGMMQHARRTPATEPSAINIDLEEDGLFSQAYAWKIRGTARFEFNRGLITYHSRTADYPKQPVSRNEKMTTADIVADTTMTLVSDEMRDPAWMQQYGKEIDVYSAARRKLFNTLREEKAAAADKRFDPVTHDAAVAAFKSATKGLTQPGMSDLISGVERAVAYEDHHRDQHQQAGEVLHRSAADWSVTDLTGKTHSLAEQRGKVVVLDFWYRGCGPCMLAMPTMVQLANEYKDKPVAFFGMNTDDELADAQSVVDKFKIPYPILRTHFPPSGKYDSPATMPSDLNIPAASYAVEAYPTIILIDGNGVLQSREVGVIPDMHDSLKKKIDELLAQTSSNGH